MKQLPDGFLSSLVSLLTNFVLVVIFTGFLVFTSSAFTGVLADMNKKIGTYISIKSLISLITGLAVFLLCWAFSIDFALIPVTHWPPAN